jgi:hypothetical protein
MELIADFLCFAEHRDESIDSEDPQLIVMVATHVVSSRGISVFKLSENVGGALHMLHAAWTTLDDLDRFGTACQHYVD